MNQHDTQLYAICNTHPDQAQGIPVQGVLEGPLGPGHLRHHAAPMPPCASATSTARSSPAAPSFVDLAAQHSNWSSRRGGDLGCYCYTIWLIAQLHNAAVHITGDSVYVLLLLDGAFLTCRYMPFFLGSTFLYHGRAREDATWRPQSLGILLQPGDGEDSLIRTVFVGSLFSQRFWTFISVNITMVLSLLSTFLFGCYVLARCLLKFLYYACVELMRM